MAKLIDELQLQSALAHQRQWGGKLGDILVNNGFLDEMMLWRGLSKQLNVQLVSLPELKIIPGLEKQIPLDLCLKNSIFPIHRDDKGMTVATSDPGNIGGLDEISFRLGIRLKTVLAPDREIEWAIRRYHQGDPAPCPPPRLRRQMDAASAPPAQAPSQPAMEIQRSQYPTAPGPVASVSTSPAEMAAIAARAAAAVAAVTGPPAYPPTPYAGPSAAPWSTPSQAPSPVPMNVPPTATPQPTWSSPQQAPSESELMIRETAHLLRFIVEGCITRGVFSREDFLKKLKSM